MFIDAIVVKIRDVQASNRSAYTAIGVTADGTGTEAALEAGPLTTAVPGAGTYATNTDGRSGRRDDVGVVAGVVTEILGIAISADAYGVKAEALRVGDTTTATAADLEAPRVRFEVAAERPVKGCG